MNKIKIAIIVLLVAVIANGCRKDQNQQYTYDGPEIQVPTEDQMEVRLNAPAVVYGDNFSQLGNAFIARLQNKQTKVDNSTKIVVVDNHTILDPSVEGMKEVFDVILKNGGVMVTENPNDPNYCDGAKLFMLTLDNKNQCYVRGSQTSSKHFLVEGFAQNPETNELEIMTDIEPSVEKKTAYQIGLTADLMAGWVNEVLYRTDTKAAVRSTSVDDYAGQNISEIFDMYFYYPFLLPGFSRSRSWNSAPYRISYNIKSFYSASENKDYYVVHQEIIGANKSMWGEIETIEKDWTSFISEVSLGYYLRKVEVEHWLVDGQYKALDNNQAELRDPSPSGTAGSTSYTSGISVSINGSVGISGSGGSATIGGGVSLSESKTVSIPDVTVTNLCMESSGYAGSVPGTGNAYWRYSIPARKVSSHMGRVSFEALPNLATSTITLHNYWYWKVPNPQQYDKLMLRTRNNVVFAMTWWERNGLKTDWGNTEGGTQYTDYIVLDMPNRDVQ